MHSLLLNSFVLQDQPYPAINKFFFDIFIKRVVFNSGNINGSNVITANTIRPQWSIFKRVNMVKIPVGTGCGGATVDNRCGDPTTPANVNCFYPNVDASRNPCCSVAPCPELIESRSLNDWIYPTPGVSTSYTKLGTIQYTYGDLFPICAPVL